VRSATLPRVLDLESLVPRYLVLPISILLVAFLGITDYITGFEVSFSIFYLFPISFATLAGRRIEGYIVAVTSAVVWFVADMLSGHAYEEPLVPYWNSVVRIGYFFLHTVLLGSLRASVRRQTELSGQDPLTKAANWRRLEERMVQELGRAQRTQRPITFCYLDLDNFKSVNDSLGHETGDELLRNVVEALSAHVRPTDLLARVGGDEFAVLLPETDYDQAHAVLKRLVAEIRGEMSQHRWPVTASVGAITFTSVPGSVDAMVRRADDLMYDAKKHGKDRLIHQQWPVAVKRSVARK
jgi:diguanylate cyclase (GGDEF)-like protein